MAFSQRIRRMSQLAGEALRAHRAAEEKHAAGTTYTWKYISLFGALPAIAFCAYNMVLSEREHQEHHERLEFKPYTHMRIRKSPFPWGDGNHSLFHTSSCALPEGYED